nr:hypothetical protein [Marinicella sp. W31]MDC2877294.1 hypothetical protein [Marinicella sp. W31]
MRQKNHYAYGAGLLVSEVAHLKVRDIDSERMLLRLIERKCSKASRYCIDVTNV